MAHDELDHEIKRYKKGSGEGAGTRNRKFDKQAQDGIGKIRR